MDTKTTKAFHDEVTDIESSFRRDRTTEDDEALLARVRAAQGHPVGDDGGVLVAKYALCAIAATLKAEAAQRGAILREPSGIAVPATVREPVERAPDAYGRKDSETIVAEVEDLARLLARQNGYVFGHDPALRGVSMRSLRTTSARAATYWSRAVEVYESLTASKVSDALGDFEEGANAA